MHLGGLTDSHAKVLGCCDRLVGSNEICPTGSAEICRHSAECQRNPGSESRSIVHMEVIPNPIPE
jgi:hypothetical protein